MPDDHSEVVPLLPIPNRTVKRLSADDSADSRVKVGHCQANTKQSPTSNGRAFCFLHSHHIFNRLASSRFNAPVAHMASMVSNSQARNGWCAKYR